MITVCILVKNAEQTIQATLDSVVSFPEVLIFDTGSKDSTLKIAGMYRNTTIHKTRFTGFGPLRNAIAACAKNDWIFALDSDEIISPSLIDEINTISLSPGFVYGMPRHNFYNGKRIRGCGWSPDRVGRLYHRNHNRFSEALVHESIQTNQQIHLNAPLIHTPYRSTKDFLEKMSHYSTLFAQQNKGKRSSSFKKALGHAIFAFFRSYILKRGILDGQEGFTISLYNANTAFYKYLKLSEINKQGSI